MHRLSPRRLRRSVHWTEAIGLDLVGGVVSTADVNADSGTEQVSINTLPWTGGKVRILLVNDVAYVKGNPWGLRYRLNLTKAQAKRYAGQWISLPRGDRLSAGVADGLTLASIIHYVTPQGHLKLLRAKSHGRRLLVVQALRSGGSFTSSLSSYAKGNRLPLGWTFFNGYGNSDEGSFSKWNESMNVQAPASSTPIATVRRG